LVNRHLPPLTGLRAFEAAARLGSFAAAAGELGVTAGAISQSVRGLETHLGVPLFERRPQALLPTQAARALLPVLTASLDAIDAAVQALRTPAIAPAPPLRVASPAGFAALWLLPRLDRFHAGNPRTTVTLSATERLVEPESAGGEGSIDACIRFGRAGWSGRLECDFLFADHRIPVCSADYLQSHRFSDRPLANQILLEALSAAEDWPDWAVWSGMALAESRRLSFGDERLALDAAIRGMGIALADRALASAAIRAGQLVAPFEPLEMVRGTAWYLVYPVDIERAAGIAAFRDWLLAECSGEMP
jgi:DNA-binding transcriptional LysR family regulator